MTILEGIRAAASRGSVTFSQDASAPISRKQIGVVVVGETPYSEGFGDVGGPQWAYDPGDHGVPRPVKDMQISAADRATIDKVCAAAARCVVVIVSGRPLIIDPAQLRKMDALVEAWLPGSEGAGVADTLFGQQPFTGKLPVTWPRTLAQEPINVGDANYDPLYPFGYGLRTENNSGGDNGGGDNGGGNH
jgi:beta-glucosidase